MVNPDEEDSPSVRPKITHESMDSTRTRSHLNEARFDEQTQPQPSQEEEAADSTKAAKRQRTSSSAPGYGNQKYWEDRYRRQFEYAANKEEKEAATPDEGSTSSTPETLPYHAWYFSYAELRPLILPLLLGGRNDLQDILKVTEAEVEELEPEDVKEEPGVEKKEHFTIGDFVEKRQATTYAETSKEDEDDESQDKNDDTIGDDVDHDEFVEVREDDEDEEEEEDVVERDGLCKKGPVSVLEIGCGDVPLGAGLAVEFMELEQSTGASAAQIVKQIVCTDYSPTVVETMQSKYRKLQNIDSIQQPKAESVVDIGTVSLEFVVADARRLEYADGTFELVLEKGALDAMLSGGEENCLLIMRECARVLTVDGYIVLVSHFNAHTERGLGWVCGTRTESYFRKANCFRAS